MGLSYMWATADHPDPDGEQLRDVAKYLRWLQEAEVGHKGKLVAVFWDWASLYQDKPFFDPRRTEEQTRMFKSGLQNVNLWYCHPNTLTLMNRKTPAGRQWSYDDSGWPVSVRKTRGFGLGALSPMCCALSFIFSFVPSMPWWLCVLISLPFPIRCDNNNHTTPPNAALRAGREPVREG